MIQQASIRFRKKSYDDGFGFACLKAAYSFDITGRMDYCPEKGVSILAEGEPARISEFLMWLEQNITDASHQLTHLSNEKKRTIQ
jgi:acylphosphatase